MFKMASMYTSERISKPSNCFALILADFLAKPAIRFIGNIGLDRLNFHHAFSSSFLLVLSSTYRKQVYHMISF